MKINPFPTQTQRYCAGFAELHPNQKDAAFPVGVFGGIALFPQLPQDAAIARFAFDQLELEDIL